jgi:alkylation response protein AidB-like acyl-CoA dehydrogenase
VNFDLNEEEAMLKAAAERFVADRYDVDTRRSYLASATGFSEENWTLLGELGLIAAAFAEADGGLGIGATGLTTVFEALGHGLVVEPLIENVVLAGGVFARLAPESLRTEWLPRLVSGERRLAFAHREARARKNPVWVETRVSQNGSGVHLNGAKSLVQSGEGVDAYLVTARVAGAPGDADGVSVYLVDARSRGLAVHPWRLIDGSVAVALTLDNVAVDTSHILGGTMSDIAAAQERASLLQSAEALGIMEKLFSDTLEYLRTRKQFGVTLGSFQALQHRMVAQYAMLEQARGLLNLAMIEGTAKAIDGARAYISEASVHLGHEMIQMHGGMGVTDELSIGHGHKRLMLLSRWPDDPGAALDRFAGV